MNRINMGDIIIKSWIYPLLQYRHTSTSKEMQIGPLAVVSGESKAIKSFPKKNQNEDSNRLDSRSFQSIVFLGSIFCSDI